MALKAVVIRSSSGSTAGIVPIGGVIAWLKTYTHTPALPAQFVECNGQTLSDAGSVYNGQVIPDLNASAHAQAFILRGGTVSGSLCGNDTNCAGIALSCSSANLSVSTTDSISISGSLSGSCSASVTVSGNGTLSASAICVDGGSSIPGYFPNDTNINFSGSGSAFVDFSSGSFSGSGSSSGSGAATGCIDIVGNSNNFSVVPATYSVVWVLRIK